MNSTLYFSVHQVSCISLNFSPTYNITVTRIRVGATLIDADITALFDSGTSFTYFTDPIYSKLSESVSTSSDAYLTSIFYF